MPTDIPHAILFEHADFAGDHKHVFDHEANLAAPDDSTFNDRASSLFIESGRWALYRDSNYGERYPFTLAPGEYSHLDDVLVANDQVSSLQAQETTQERQLAHVILFQHANFRGMHKHVVSPNSNLGTPRDAAFNDQVSSAAVLAGRWNLFRDPGYGQRYAPSLNRGVYPRTFDLGITNDDVSSLRPINLTEGSTLPHVIVYEHANLHGRHKHVVAAEPNLNATDDDFFNDRISSLVVLSGNWVFYRDSNFVGQYPVVLGPGIYRSINELGLTNDQVSSLRPV